MPNKFWTFLFRVACLVMGAVCANAAPARAACGSSTVCERLDYASVVFLADVESVRRMGDSLTASADVQFRVLEVFKGRASSERTFRFGQAGTEDFPFSPGQRVLLYASAREGVLDTACTGTTYASEAEAELKILRALVRGRPGGPLDGHLVPVDDGRELPTQQPDFRVTLRLKSGRGTAQSARIGGPHFEFDWVSPGDYILALDGGSSFADERREVTVRPKERCLTVTSFILRSR
jgi:hypothetical protein